MRTVPLEKCEWAVNALGNVLASSPRFHARAIHRAVRRGRLLVFHHDAGGETALPVPAAVGEYLDRVPTVLLVAFGAGGNPVEVDVPLFWPDEPGVKGDHDDAGKDA